MAEKVIVTSVVLDADNYLHTMGPDRTRALIVHNGEAMKVEGEDVRTAYDLAGLQHSKQGGDHLSLVYNALLGNVIEV